MISPYPREPCLRAKALYYCHGQRLSVQMSQGAESSWVPTVNIVGWAVLNGHEARESLSLTSAICSAPGTAELGLAEGTLYTLSAPLIDLFGENVLVMNELFPS